MTDPSADDLDRVSDPTCDDYQGGVASAKAAEEWADAPESRHVWTETERGVCCEHCDCPFTTETAMTKCPFTPNALNTTTNEMPQS